MIIFKGLGIMVGIAPCLIYMAMYALFMKDWSGPAKPWMLALSLILSGLALWFGGRALNNKCRRELVDPKTGEQVKLGAGHSLFFIPVEYWGVAFIPLGIAAFFMK